MVSLGWECHGIDASTQAIDTARRNFQRINVSVGKGIELPDPTMRFDLVMAFHVLEHVGDVNHLLAECCKLLVPGGHLVFFVPNWNSWSRRVLGDYWPDFMPEHIHYFSEKSIGALLQRHCCDISYWETGSSSWSWLAGVNRLLHGRESTRSRLDPTSREMPGKAKMRLLDIADTLLRPLFFLETRRGCGNELRIIARRRS
jgi:SAM-dependent methyltransferase